MNQFCCCGRLVADPEKQTSENGNSYLKFTLAVPRSSKNADGEYYFVKDNITFTTPSLNPFEVLRSWDMCLMASDGSMLKVSKSF